MSTLHPLLLKHCIINDDDIALNTNTIDSIIETLCDDKIFVVPLLNEKHCKSLCDAFDLWDQSKDSKNLPNGLSTDGLIPHQFGCNLDTEIVNIFKSLSEYLFGYKQRGESVLSDYSYLIRYKKGGDEQLKCHCDDSDITINICLNSDCKGSELYFYPNLDQNAMGTPPPPDDTDNDGDDEQKENDNQYLEYQHQRGYAVIHRGDIYHGVKQLKDGKRYNLVHWIMIGKKEECQWKSDFFNDYIIQQPLTDHVQCPI